MARPRSGKPWLRKSDNCYYTTIGHENIKLGKGTDPPEKIQQAYHAALAGFERITAKSVQWLIREFLADCKKHQAARTHQWYEDFLDSFKASIRPHLLPEQVTFKTVDDWIAKSYGESKPSTKNGAARSVVRVFNWSVANKYIPQSPLAGYKKPSARAREICLTKAQYNTVLLFAREPLKSAIKFMRLTGCRPREMRVIEFKHLDGDKLILPFKDSKGQKKRRVIYLNKAAKEIFEYHAADNLIGPVFRNSCHEPWTKGSLNNAVRRLRNRIAKKATAIEGLCPYVFRHTWATEQLKKGVDVATVAALMGNSPQVVLETYQHVARDEDHLLSVVNAGH